MNCEQVEELLSAYLDDALAEEEGTGSGARLRQAITLHLAGCRRCSATLADFRHFDALLAQLPRVGPRPALRNKIFSSPQYLELTGTYNKRDEMDTRPYGSVRSPTAGRPQLVALPGGRPSSSARRALAARVQRGRGSWGLRAMQIAIAAALLLTIGVAGLISRNLWLQYRQSLTTNGAIIPPAGINQHAPLSAGMRFVYLRAGTLWSAPGDSSDGPVQPLTPSQVTVAANWAVSPPLPGRSAGDMIAYIDLQRARLHTIRSDGQRDTIIAQPLLKAGVAPATIWETASGEAILHSLTWSKDGSMLAFVADPTASGSSSLYILNLATATLATVPLPVKGNVSDLVWSPDGIRITFALTHGGLVSILDYNTQNNGLLELVNSISSRAHPNDTLLTLDWSPNVNAPAITWSVGDTNAVHSLWLHPVGMEATAAPQLLLSGQYAQAVYSRNGDGGVGSWLLEDSAGGRAANILRIDVAPGALPQVLIRGRRPGFMQWSPDGTRIDYLDENTANAGSLHVVNVSTGIDTLLAQAVANEPLPAWSEDGQHLAYSTGAQVVVVNLQNGKQLEHISLHGTASSLLWSATTPSHLVVAFSDGAPGTFLVDIQQNTTHLVDRQGISGAVLWTEVP